MEEIINRLCDALNIENAFSEKLKNKIVLILSDYEITRKSTELVAYNYADYNAMIMNKFLISKTVKGLTSKTLNLYKFRIEYALSKIQKPINEITSDDLIVYFAQRQLIDKTSSATAINEWRVLSGFFGWMYKEEIIPKNPMFKVEKPKERKQKKKAFTSMECELLRDSCTNLRDKAIIEVLLSTWCRVSEIVQMNISDIRGDEITVVGKGEKERVVYLNSKAILAIKNYLNSRTDNNDALFVSRYAPYERVNVRGIEDLIKKIGKKAGVQDAHPHKFRRTGATMALRSGMPIEKVSYLLGHESIDTTQIYLDINEYEVKQSHQKYVA